MIETTEFNSKRDFKIVLEDTFLFFTKNVGPLCKCYFVYCGVPLLASFFMQLYELASPSTIAPGLFSFFTTFNVPGIIAFVISGVLEGVLAILTFHFINFYRKNQNTAPTIKQIWHELKHGFWASLTMYLIIKFILKVAFKLFWLPGLYLWPPLSLVLPAYIFQKLNYRDAVKQSFILAKSNFAIILGILIAFYFATSLFIMLPQALLHFVATGSFKPSKIILPLNYRVIIATIIQIMKVLFILPNIAIAFCYFASEQDLHEPNQIN